MSQQCFACYGFRLEEINGVRYCLDCGTQTQAQVEEAEYGDVGGEGASRRRAAGSTATAALAPVTEDEADPSMIAADIKQQAAAYVRCLQLLLQAQASALVTTFGVMPEATSLMRHLWFSLIPHSSLLGFDYYAWRDENIRQAAAVIAEEAKHGVANPFERRRSPREAGAGEDDDSDSQSDGSSDSRGETVSEDSDQGSGGEGGGRGRKAGRGRGRKGKGLKARFFFSGLGSNSNAGASSGSRAQESSIKHWRKLEEAAQALEGAGAGVEGEAGKRRADEALRRLAQNPNPLVTILARELHPSITLVIAYVACLMLKQPVSANDIVRWALDGRLPYLDANARCSALLAGLPQYQSRVLTLTLTRHTAVTSAASLMTAALDLAALLKLQLPPVNAPLLLARAAADLGLPQGVLLVALELYRLYLADSPVLLLQSVSRRHHPYCMLMVLLTEAVRLCYGLDGLNGNRARLHGLPPPPLAVAVTADGGAAVTGLAASLPVPQPPPLSAMLAASLQPPRQLGRDADQLAAGQVLVTAMETVEKEVAEKVAAGARSGWGQWAAARLAELACPSGYPVSTWQACQLRGEALVSYLTFCERVMGGHAAAHTGATASDAMPVAGGMEGGGGRAGGVLSEARAVVGRTGVGVEGLVGALQDDLRQGQAGTSRQAGQQQEQEQSQGHGQGLPGFAKGTIPIRPPQSKGAAGSPQNLVLHHVPVKRSDTGTLNYEAVGYGQIPNIALRPLKHSPHTAHPDLWAVASTCAGYANTQPAVLLRLLQALEGRMVAGEEWVDDLAWEAHQAQEKELARSKKRRREREEEIWGRGAGRRGGEQQAGLGGREEEIRGRGEQEDQQDGGVGSQGGGEAWDEAQDWMEEQGGGGGGMDLEGTSEEERSVGEGEGAVGGEDGRGEGPGQGGLVSRGGQRPAAHQPRTQSNRLSESSEEGTSEEGSSEEAGGDSDSDSDSGVPQNDVGGLFKVGEGDLSSSSEFSGSQMSDE